MQKEDENYIISELISLHDTTDANDSRVKVYCQPIFDTETGRYDTAEALARFETEKLGLLQPIHFIKLAEENGRIHALSLNVLNKVCEEIKNMVQAGIALRWISVNFSVSEFRDEKFCKEILSIIDSYDIPRSMIAIELTETSNDADIEQIKQCMNFLGKEGISFFLDDFGSEYSNFDRLVLLPFDVIKFDRTLMFLATKDDDKSFKAISGLSDLFRSMDFKVLFEGVETEKDAITCLAMGADYLQGFLYSRPIPIKDYEKFLSEDTGKCNRKESEGMK